MALSTSIYHSFEIDLNFVCIFQGATPSKKRRISKDDAVVPSLEEHKEESEKEEKTTQTTKQGSDKPSQADASEKDIDVSDEKLEDSKNVSKSKDENEEKEEVENSPTKTEVDESVNVPSTSKGETVDSTASKSSKDESPQTASTAVPWQHIPRERQTIVDTVAKQIESLFALLGKKWCLRI